MSNLHLIKLILIIIIEYNCSVYFLIVINVQLLNMSVAYFCLFSVYFSKIIYCALTWRAVFSINKGREVIENIKIKRKLRKF